MYNLLLFVGVVCNVLAQLLLKHGMKGFELIHARDSFLPRMFSVIKNPYVISALMSYGVGFALYSLAISKMELSRAYPAASVTAILMLSVISMVFMNEAVTSVKVAGLSFCILGILLVLS